jgi:hypothetical protein
MKWGKKKKNSPLSQKSEHFKKKHSNSDKEAVFLYLATFRHFSTEKLFLKCKFDLLLLLLLLLFWVKFRQILDIKIFNF